MLIGGIAWQGPWGAKKPGKIPRQRAMNRTRKQCTQAKRGTSAAESTRSKNRRKYDVESTARAVAMEDNESSPRTAWGAGTRLRETSLDPHSRRSTCNTFFVKVHLTITLFCL